MTVMRVRDVGVGDGHAVLLHRGGVRKRLGGGDAAKAWESCDGVAEKIVQAARSDYRHNVFVTVEGVEADVTAGLVRQGIGLVVTSGAHGIIGSAVDRDAYEVFGSLAGIAGRFDRANRDQKR